MAPKTPDVAAGLSFETDGEFLLEKPRRKNPHDAEHKHQILWINVIWMAYLHVGAVYGLYFAFHSSTKWATVALNVMMYFITGLGITAGVHRLFSHRSYRANLPLRILLVAFNSTAFQNSVLSWSRDHRVHHKYVETDADPYNAKRGFFFAHVGWLMVRKHPDVLAKGKTVDVSDLTSDPIVMFQHRYYKTLVMPLFTFILPTLIPMFAWSETFHNSWHLNLLRYCITLNVTSLVNSLAHLHGDKPYDKNIGPGDSRPLSMWTLGEGWHNFHHVFPWDHRAEELGNHHPSFTTHFINLCAWLGWATELKTVSTALVKSRAKRTGDGSHPVWGWGDRDMASEDKEMARVLGGHP